MSEMTPRERVNRSLAHQEPDRVPLDVGGGQSTTLVEEAYESLTRYLGITAPRVPLNRVLRLVRLDEETAVRLGSDVRPLTLALGLTGPPLPGQSEGPTFTDELGVTWRQVPFEGGYYWGQATYPLAEATIDDLDVYPWPDPEDPSRYAGLREEVERLYFGTSYALMGDPGYKGFWEPTFMLLGFERALMALVVEPEFVEALMEKLFTIVSIVTRRFLEIAGPYLSVIRTADDVATQESLLMSPDTYRSVIKPFHQRYFTLIKQYTDARIFYHTDGNVVPLLDDLIDAGVEVLNPLQVSAINDPAAVKDTFGDRLSFWGGIDTQWVLPSGSPDDVREEVKLRIEQLGQGGGYVAAPVHNIQADVPAENVMAMCEAVRTFGAYGHAASSKSR